MSLHPEHQMQLSSLLCKWGNIDESQFNSKFRQEVERKIIRFHLEHPEGLTDEELLALFGNPDTNLVRPRRSDLSKERLTREGKRRKEYGLDIKSEHITRPSILFDSGRMKKNKWDSVCIIWKLNPDNLNAYLS